MHEEACLRRSRFFSTSGGQVYAEKAWTYECAWIPPTSSTIRTELKRLAQR